jgi:hypothetical protein
MTSTRAGSSIRASHSSETAHLNLAAPMPRSRNAVLAAIVVAIVVGTGFASAEVFSKGNLLVSLKGNFSPQDLPRNRPAPVSVNLTGKIRTTDGSTPPPLRRVEIALNRHGRMSNRGLATCTSRELQSTTSEAALARCGPARVGGGRFSVNVDFPTTPTFPATGRILAFNGKHNGRPVVLLHLYGTTPVRATFVLPLTVSHTGKGDFGTVLSANLPTLAGGVGSITELELRIGRTWSYRGQRRSFLSAACSVPEPFRRLPFSLAKGTFRFADSRVISPTLSGVCRVRGS